MPSEPNSAPGGTMQGRNPTAAINALPSDQQARRRRVALLGATGSIGQSTLDVIEADPQRYELWALSGHGKVDLLRELAERFRPHWMIGTDETLCQQTDWSKLPPDVRLKIGEEALVDAATHPEVDVVVAAIVGYAGLPSTWAALGAGKTVGLANKESLVVAGPLMLQQARRGGGQIVPVDSEHSAIFQAMQSGRRAEVARIILTASGGPFRRHSLEQLRQATVADALNHPTWEMGPKITVDSATMMNKALEIVEARWLFDLRPDQIQVMVHPQSVVHSFVEYVDGSVVAQLSPPDMRLPIQYALSYPERHPGVARRMDWSTAWELQFEPPDFERFPALQLGLDVAAAGGTAGAVVNAANEAAVSKFLAGELAYLDIVPTCRRMLEHHDFDPNPTLEQLMAADRWARQEVLRWITAC